MSMTRRHLRFLVVGLFILFSLLSLRPDRATSQESEQTIHSSADYTFGQTMRFRLTADNTEQVMAITLFFRSPESANTYSVDVPFERGASFEIVYPVDLSQLRLAPFTTVSYWWTLSTSDGQEITVAKKTLAYNDDRFEWRSSSQNGNTVYWTGSDGQVGQLALVTMSETLAKLQPIYSIRDRVPLYLYIYPKTADLRAALRLTGRDLVSGHAHPELGVLLVTAVNSRTAETDLRRDIPHEMAHFLLYQQVGSAYASVPLWFNEGLAAFSELEPDPSDEARLKDAVEQETTISFADLCQRFPESEERVLLARAQSGSMISFIQKHFGNHELAALIRAFGEGEDCHSGVNRVLRLSLEELERNWLRDQQPRTPIVQRLSENGLLLILLAGGFGVARLLILKPDGYPDGYEED